MTERPAFRVIPGGLGDAPAKPRKGPRARQIWPGCEACEVATGNRSRALVPIILGPELDPEGRLVGGKKARACFLCASRGQLTLYT